MSSPLTPQGPPTGPVSWQEAQAFWLSKISAQLADIEAVVVGLLIAMGILIFLVLTGFAR